MSSFSKNLNLTFSHLFSIKLKIPSKKRAKNHLNETIIPYALSKPLPFL